MKLTNEDIQQIDKLYDICKKGWYADSMTVTNLYNKVLEKREGNTNCGSCIRRRILELWAAKEAILKQLEKEQKEEGQSDVQQEENNVTESPVEAVPEVKKTNRRKVRK